MQQPVLGRPTAFERSTLACGHAGCTRLMGAGVRPAAATSARAGIGLARPMSWVLQRARTNAWVIKYFSWRCGLSHCHQRVYNCPLFGLWALRFKQCAPAAGTHFCGKPRRPHAFVRRQVAARRARAPLRFITTRHYTILRASLHAGAHVCSLTVCGIRAGIVSSSALELVWGATQGLGSHLNGGRCCI